MNKKVIMIVGANSNIGSKLAENFLSEDFSLLLLVHQNTNNIDQFISGQRNVHFSKCDLANWGETKLTVDRLIHESGLIPYALIHTATIRSDDSLPLLETDPAKWASVINTNVISAYHIVKAVLPYMLQQAEGRIVLFGSDVSRNGLAYGSAYAASKAAISNLGRSLSLELADSGVLINTISPGPVMTEDRQFEHQYREFRKEYFSKKIQDIPLHRVANISDIYPLCRFLISDENTYLTGDEIFLTGGKT